MYGNSIFQKDHPQISIVCFLYFLPLPNAPVGLDFLNIWSQNSAF